MKKIHLILLAVIALLFLFTAIWKYDLPTETNQPEFPEQQTDRSSLRIFWDHFNAGSANLIDAKYSVAAANFEQSLQLNNQHEGTLYNLGMARLFLKDFTEAETHWLLLAKINDTSARARMQLGTLYFCMHEQNPLYDADRAEFYFIEAHRLNREETGPLLKLAKIAFLKNHIPKADQYVNIVTASNFRSYQAYFLNGYIHWKMDRFKPAEQNLAEAIRIYQTLESATVQGEGATKAGAVAMLSEDRFCDQFEIRIGELLSENDTENPLSAYQTFSKELGNWQALYR